ncbi:MAPEG family protein [Aliiroseovarius sp. S2029]|uniref:MAPEG family protein n=1 Tax=Aliiroseovarius sp. S2029 TaxID=2936988 RepID=UPI0020BE7DE1|nr:MAPEG family protein [Aliiroseovarius sp. S2029]MCK8482746.1 MAPEG family protein [Aliiroseovarius sp. S2029]
MSDSAARIRKFTRIIVVYPIGLIVIAMVVNLILGIEPLTVALPSVGVMAALVVASALLLLNHTWLMTATELTRLHHGIYASPEEYAEANARKEDVPALGWSALERHHNAHRNATENTVYFGGLALLMALASPSTLAAQIWIIGFAIGRLGYTYSALRGKAGLRGIFMSVSLAALYGMAGYLLLALMW